MKPTQCLSIRGRCDGLHDATWTDETSVANETWMVEGLNDEQIKLLMKWAIEKSKRCPILDWDLRHTASKKTLDQFFNTESI